MNISLSHHRLYAIKSIVSTEPWTIHISVNYNHSLITRASHAATEPSHKRSKRRIDLLWPTTMVNWYS